MANSRKKVFVMLPVATGHINPAVCICSELVKNNVDVTFYSTEEYRDVIERSGAKFALYTSYREYVTEPKGMDEKDQILKQISRFLSFTNYILPQLLEDFEREKPELIICDKLSLQARYLGEIIKMRYKKGLSTTKPPKMVEACSHFVISPGIFPSVKEVNEMLSRNQSFWFIFILIGMFIKQFIMSWRFGLNIYNPMKYFLNTDDSMHTIVSVFPELQPKHDVFEKKNYKFIGACFKDNVRGAEIKDAQLKQVFDTFKPRNPVSSIEQMNESNKRLVFVSLGTVFNENEKVMMKIIDGIKKYQARSDRFELTVLLSLGRLYDQFKTRNVKLPDNFVMQPSVPQLEVLKRASLFVTHCGMNSSCETIHFGVPIVAIPLMAEQPLNAQRLTDELGFGKQLDVFKLDSEEISEAIEGVLSNPAYLERILLYSKISRRYDGSTLGCQEILKHLN